MLIHPALPDTDTSHDNLVLNLGCGKHPIPGWFNIDQTPPDEYVGMFWIADLDDPTLELPWGDSPQPEEGFVGVYASHVIEHLRNPLTMMQEVWRVCEPGAVAVFKTPYGSSDDAWENQTHVRPYYVGSWGFFGQPHYWREDYGYTADWQVREVELVLHDNWVPENITIENLGATYAAVNQHRNVVAEMTAVLECVKPARPADRALQGGFDIVLMRKVAVDAWSWQTQEIGRLRREVQT